MKITIHRGTHQIGGCATEIASEKGTRILIDAGAELPSGNREPKALRVRGFTNCECKVKARCSCKCDCKGECQCKQVFFTHHHGDHISEYIRIQDSIPIYMGEASREIFKIWQERLLDFAEDVTDANIDRISRFRLFKDCEPVELNNGDMKITPIQTDHSAFDSYMFLVEADGQSVLHTGDFRTHGLSGSEFIQKLEKLVGNKGKEIDVLICEGTMISRKKENGSKEGEYTLEDMYTEAKESMSQNRNVFVLCSSINIDSIAMFYKAALDNGKMFIVLEKDFQLEILKTVRAFSKGNDDYKFDENKINPYDKGLLSKMKNSENGFCMMVTGNKTSERAMKNFKDHLLIYSVWDGYLYEPYNNIPAYKKYSDFVMKSKEISGKKHKYIHSGGHASTKAINKVIKITKPKVIIPMHGEKPENFKELKRSENSKIVIMNDRETYDMKSGEIDEFTPEEWRTRMLYAKGAHEIWEDFKKERVSERFHLRPYSKGIMVICTIPKRKGAKNYSMTGISCTINGNVHGLRDKLDSLNKTILRNKGFTNIENLLEAEEELGFKYRKTDAEDAEITKYPEYTMQSNFINMLVNNTVEKKEFEDRLKDKLGKSCNLQFVASEFVIHKGYSKKDIVDVVAYCEETKTLYMFELKVPDENDEAYNDVKKQVGRYIAKYGEGGRRYDEMREILALYPHGNVPDKVNVAKIPVKFFVVKAEKGNLTNFKPLKIDELNSEC